MYIRYCVNQALVAAEGVKASLRGITSQPVADLVAKVATAILVGVGLVLSPFYILYSEIFGSSHFVSTQERDRDVSKLNQSIARAEQAASSARREAAEERRVHADRPNADAQKIQQLETDLAGLRESLQEKLEEIQTKETEIQASRTRMQELTRKLEAVCQESEQINRQSLERNSELTQARSALREAEALNAELTEGLLTAQAKMESLQTEVTEKTAKVRDLERELNFKQGELQTQAPQHQISQIEVDEIRRKAEAEQAQWQQVLQDSKDRIQLLEKQLTEICGQKEQAELELSEITAKLEQSQTVLRETEASTRELINGLKAMQSQIQSREKELTDIRREKEQAEQQLREMAAKLIQAQEALAQRLVPLPEPKEPLPSSTEGVLVLPVLERRPELRAGPASPVAAPASWAQADILRILQEKRDLEGAIQQEWLTLLTAFNLFATTSDFKKLRDAALENFTQSLYRYKTVICFPQTQVRLEGCPPFHANRILGKYIATQGPLQKTKYDFWTMVLTAPSPRGSQSKGKRIVRLTDYQEPKVDQQGRSKMADKCYQYLPPRAMRFSTGSREYRSSDQRVTILEGSREAPQVRLTELDMVATDPQETQRIQQYALLGWKDQQVTDPKQLARFVQTIHKAQQLDPQPLIVHGSAGVGRTGCFLAIYELYDRILKGEIKTQERAEKMVLTMVQDLRRDRYWMVQVPEQYALIYTTLIELLQ